MSESATERLSRLLAMVPWLLAHQGVPLADAAAEFGVDERQLVKDLELLFVCGLPGHLPDDLIEADWEEGFVYLGNADAISRPLRLGVDEALALIVGLRTLMDVPGVGDRDAVRRALVKLEAAAGAAGQPAGSVRVDLGQVADADVLTTAEDALRLRRRLHLGYLVPHRDETTERDVDPMRVLHVDGRWYLEGWCHRAEGVRLFRLDRVVSARILDVDGTPPAEAQGRDLDGDLFAPGPDDHVVTLALRPSARWVVDYYPVDRVTETSDGDLVVTLRTGDLAWLRQLALRLGGSGRIVDPPELADDVRRVAAAALEGYGERDS
ncbi:helix-turn-helix transcriptional regulator [Angustibacter luteus]|uniref:Helix-turn-helix transcriptional regulator n=1 Tax=Angustibacter luteus TaxID=658456 RepID=A0ABW1J9N8_9ACTN